MNKNQAEVRFERAASKIRKMHTRLKSWKNVSDELGGGLNRGVLSSIASGKRRATPQVMTALGMTPIKMKLAPVCPLCGEVHISKRCAHQSRRPTRPHRNYRRALIESLAILWGQSEAREGEEQGGQRETNE